jgi:hypothetical protein
VAALFFIAYLPLISVENGRPVETREALPGNESIVIDGCFD